MFDINEKVNRISEAMLSLGFLKIKIPYHILDPKFGKII